jgi:hypothetical protein
VERQERRAAGLQFDPRVFDPAGRDRPSVFAEMPRAGQSWTYQHFRLNTTGRDYSPTAMIFAQATSPTSGRIASLVMNLPSKPVERAKLTIAWRENCRIRRTLLIYAPALSVPQLRRLAAQPECWSYPGSCAQTQRPRGRVLFVSSLRSGVGHEYRWIDYDMLMRN